jgi:hypothetical protein
MNHMIYVGYSISFSNTFLFGEEEGDSQNPQALSIEKKQDDIETIISTTDQHRQREKLLMRGVLGLLMFHRKMTYQNKNLSQQCRNKGNIHWTILMMEEIITLLREVLKGLINSSD